MQTLNKGGISGLQYSDFNQRQKSGVWTIDDNSADVNYIRSSQIPNMYLTVGSYNAESLALYDLFLNNKVSTNIFNIPISTVTCIEYNLQKNLLAFGLTESPYLKIYDTENFTEYTLTKTFTSPITTIQFTHLGDYIFVGTIDKVNSSYLNIYNIDNLISVVNIYTPTIGSQGPQGIDFNYTSVNPEISIIIDFLITSIRLSNDDNYLCIGHYGSISDEYNNINLFKKINGVYTDVNEYNINSLDLGTISDICFVDNYLFIGSYQSQYLTVYDYDRQDLITVYDNNIITNITSKINCLCLTKDKSKLLIGCDSSPYVYMLNLSTKEITSLGMDTFDDNITSISLSYGDKYICITSRGSNPLQVFDFTDQTLSTPVVLNTYPSTISFSSKFIFGPLTKYTDVSVPTYSVSSDDNGSIGVVNNSLVFTGSYYDDQIITSSPDLAAYQEIFDAQIYNSLDYNSTYITAIKIDGTLITNDPNIPKNYYNNIIQVSTYYSRIALLDIYGSVQVTNINGFSNSEVYYISTILKENIKQISTGYTILLALTTNFIPISTNTTIFDPNAQVLPPIKQVSAGYDHVSLLTESNTVLSFGVNDYGECDTSTWTNIKKVCCADTFTLALSNTNDLFIAGDTNISNIESILLTQNVIDIFTGPNTIILITADNTATIYYLDTISTLQI